MNKQKMLALFGEACDLQRVIAEGAAKIAAEYGEGQIPGAGIGIVKTDIEEACDILREWGEPVTAAYQDEQAPATQASAEPATPQQLLTEMVQTLGPQFAADQPVSGADVVDWLSGFLPRAQTSLALVKGPEVPA